MFFWCPLVHTRFSLVSIAILPEYWHWNHMAVSCKRQTWFQLGEMRGQSWPIKNANHWLWRVWEGSKVWTNSLLGNRCPSMSHLESVNLHVCRCALCLSSSLVGESLHLKDQTASTMSKGFDLSIDDLFIRRQCLNLLNFLNSLAIASLNWDQSSCFRVLLRYMTSGSPWEVKEANANGWRWLMLLSGRVLWRSYLVKNAQRVENALGSAEEGALAACWASAPNRTLTFC